MCVVGASLAPFGALIFIVSARFLIVHVSFSFSSYYLLTTRQEPSHTILCRVLNKSPVTSVRFSEVTSGEFADAQRAQKVGRAATPMPFNHGKPYDFISTAKLAQGHTPRNQHPARQHAARQHAASTVKRATHRQQPGECSRHGERSAACFASRRFWLGGPCCGS